MSTHYTPYSDVFASTTNNVFTSDTTTIFTSDSTKYTPYSDTLFSTTTNVPSYDYDASVKRTQSMKEILEQAIEDQLWNS